jgi:hypothetical protein
MSSLPIDRLIEVSADATAATVSGIQKLSDRRQNFSLRQTASGAVSGGTRYLLARLTPGHQRPERRRGPALSLLQLLVAGGVPATSAIARGLFMGTIRAAPVVWKVSRDKRAQSAAAILVRIVFGHRRRQSH